MLILHRFTMMWSVLLLGALAATALSQADDTRVRYDGYHTLAVGPLNTRRDVAFLKSLVDHTEGRRQVIAEDDVITNKAPVTLYVAPEAYEELTLRLREYGLPSEVINIDLQKQFDYNNKINEMSKSLFNKFFQTNGGASSAPTYYMRFDEMMNWLSNAAASSSVASIFTVGTSYQGRSVKGIAINDGKNLPAVWVDAGIHAREWIAPATALYIIDKILFGTDSNSVFMRTNYRWYIAPEVNPDGYEYSWTNNRLWRKTRQPYGSCVGADPNRNFDQFWGRYGTSTNPCSDTYGGPRPFSEPEVVNVANAIQSRSSNMALVFSMHSYTQLWLLPWGGDYSKPSDYSELLSIANRAASAARAVNGRSFTVGTPPDILYAASGGTFDWAKGKAGVKYSYTPELRPASQWEGGFDIPASNIYPSGAEIFAGLASTVRDIYSAEYADN